MMILSQYHIFELDTINIYSAASSAFYPAPSENYTLYSLSYCLILHPILLVTVFSLFCLLVTLLVMD
jgi:hypothetical protein